MINISSIIKSIRKLCTGSAQAVLMFLARCAPAFKGPKSIDCDKPLNQENALKQKARQKAANARPVKNRAQNILDSWIVVEALSPKGYKNPEKLAAGLHGKLMSFDTNKELWLHDPRPRSKDKSVYYLVYLGAIQLDRAFKELIKIYGDDRYELGGKEDFAALGLVVLDECGVPILNTGLSLSSFGWAYGRARKKRLKDLKHWTQTEKKIIKGLSKFIYPQNNKGDVAVLTLGAVHKAYKWMIKKYNLPKDQLLPPKFAIRLKRKKGSTPETILNSFYLEDLRRVKGALSEGRGGDALEQYLGIKPCKDSVDLLNSSNKNKINGSNKNKINGSEANKIIEQYVQPNITPLGRWPGKGRYPLVLLQQTAVNLAFQELKDSGVFSVNGPPGTGKTTLLRDIIAGILIKRAEAMCTFDDPASAFESIDSMKTKKYGYVHFYKPNARLLGYEILVASSNNNAVENITKELPLKQAIAEDVTGLRYFKTLSDALSGSKDSTWGLIAAALGRSENRNAFSQTVWWDKNVSLQVYIDSIINSIAKTGKENINIDNIVANENPPQNLAEAKERWKRAKEQFELALKRSCEMTSQVQGAYDAQKYIDEQLPILEQTNSRVEKMKSVCEREDTSYQQAIKHQNEVKENLTSESECERRSNQNKPSWLLRIFKRVEWNSWRAKHKEIHKRLLDVRNYHSYSLKDIKIKEQKLQLSKQEYTKEQREVKNITSEKERQQQKIDDAMIYCGDNIISQSFWKKSYDDCQKSSPNFSKKAHLLRDEVFIAAINLHKAFIDAASKKLKHNLRLFCGEMATDKIPQEKRHHLPLIWQSIFLFTPVISTTFASVGRMLKDLPQESIGWLLIDEAGQAKPQEAIGAIYRAKRVMSVGDPLQVEPIEPLPLPLVKNVTKYLGVDVLRWMAPHASVQSLADHANCFGATIKRRDGDVRIGSPLVVHRRCDDPMFSISNELAYEGMMVHATPSEPSPIVGVLGKSRWFDIVGTAQEKEKWCLEEGNYMLTMVMKMLKKLEEAPDFYVISPFKIVAQKAFCLLNSQSESKEFKVKGIDGKWLQKRVGTVHTFQGKEADTVILLLGAPAKEQLGARRWATSQVNLLNVAVSRAKHNLYVIGNKSLWGDLRCMKVVSSYLEA